MNALILFVCTGNTCRSVMAEALMRRLLEDDCGNITFTVSSAGLAPTEKQASPYTRKLLAREGIFVESHIPRHLTESLVKEARLILVMEEHHRRAVLGLYPRAEGKIYLLKEFAGISGEFLGVEDPYGASLEIYERTLEEIRGAIKKVIKKLLMVKKKPDGNEEASPK